MASNKFWLNPGSVASTEVHVKSSSDAPLDLRRLNYVEFPLFMTGTSLEDMDSSSIAHTPSKVVVMLFTLLAALLGATSALKLNKPALPKAQLAMAVLPGTPSSHSAPKRWKGWAGSALTSGSHWWVSGVQ